MERPLRSQNRRNRCLKRIKRLRMGWRIRITRLSSIRYRKSQNHHRWSLKIRLFLIKRKHRFRSSISTLLKTRQNSIQKIILVQNLQLIILNHRFCPRSSWLIHRTKSYRLMWFFIRQNCRIQRNRKKRLLTLRWRIQQRKNSISWKTQPSQQGNHRLRIINLRLKQKNRPMSSRKSRLRRKIKIKNRWTRRLINLLWWRQCCLCPKKRSQKWRKRSCFWCHRTYVIQLKNFQIIRCQQNGYWRLKS